MENNKLSIVDAKNSAREQAKAVRQKIHGSAPPSNYTDLSQHLLNHLKKLGHKNKNIAGFWPLGSEIDVRIAMFDLSRHGHALCLPTIEEKDQPLLFKHYESGDELQKGMFGTLEPSLDAPKVIPDIILVPLLAFDEYGHRLGYGGGYYDRTVSLINGQKAVLTIGLAFAGQQVRQVPSEAHDMKLDYIITELGLCAFDKAV